MNRKKITISDEGAVAVPVGVRMTVCEIANVFGVYYQTVKRYIAFANAHPHLIHLIFYVILPPNVS